jgi:predicted O-linked N-acetylglucosamine transferase (SPINDLY family)
MIESRSAGGKIRIGYYSADFYSDATSVLMAELIEEYDTRALELYGFSFGPGKKPDQVYVKALMDGFRFLVNAIKILKHCLVTFTGYIDGLR